ncbi:Na+/H+ antiporter NhaA [Streptomyces chattanoogensis]|uniref:Na+/H+ antiporter NhaA n=1 Tax=Streptomyces chattanoogensis TaxID=66876 RepID=UPI00368B2E7C
MPAALRERSVFLALLPWPERVQVARALRTETVGGLVLLAAAVVALVWANTPISGTYEQIRDFHFGIPALGLDLSVEHWTADGLLTIFFLVAGIELKRELVVGELRTPATAALPVVAALCGMAVPAALYLATTGLAGGSAQGWAVPMATDIAFALAVLAVLSSHLPSALRAFLLTLAVVDDLGAILVIAVFFTADLSPAALGGAVAGLVVFYLLQRYRVRGWWWYVPLGLAIWALMYNGGVHATVAGVAMGLILRTTRDQGEKASPGERTEHLLRPVSAGVAVPLFALFAAGVSISADGGGSRPPSPSPTTSGPGAGARAVPADALRPSTSPGTAAAVPSSDASASGSSTARCPADTTNATTSSTAPSPSQRSSSGSATPSKSHQKRPSPLARGRHGLARPHSSHTDLCRTVQPLGRLRPPPARGARPQPLHQDVIDRTTALIKEAGYSVDVDLWGPPDGDLVSVASSCRHSDDHGPIVPIPKPKG